MIGKVPPDLAALAFFPTPDEDRAAGAVYGARGGVLPAGHPSARGPCRRAADEDEDGRREDELPPPVAEMRERQGHWFTEERSHRPRLVKPTMTTSIHAWERTASRASR